MKALTWLRHDGKWALACFECIMYSMCEWVVGYISATGNDTLSVCVCPSFQLSFQHKVGVLYCKAGQSTEEEMYNNESAGPALDEFLDLLGQRVRLKGFTKYRAQLDNKSKIKTHTELNSPKVQAHTLLILLSADALLCFVAFFGSCDVF